MNPKLRKTLMAGAIAAMITSPAWAASDTTERTQESPQVQPGQSQTQPDASPPMGRGPGDTPPMGQGRGVGPGDTPPMGRGPADRPQTEGQASVPGDTPQIGAAPRDAHADNPLYTRTPEELKDFDIVDAEGDKIGSVKAVVLGPERDTAHIVVGVGGLLGMGQREILISLDELELVGSDELRISATEEQLEAREEYVSELYVELDPDRPINEFAAFEPMQQDPAAPGAVQRRDTAPGAVERREAAPGTVTPRTEPMTPRDTEPGAGSRPAEPRAPQ